MAEYSLIGEAFLNSLCVIVSLSIVYDGLCMSL